MRRKRVCRRVRDRLPCRGGYAGSGNYNRNEQGSQVAVLLRFYPSALGTGPYTTMRQQQNVTKVIQYL